MHMISNYLHDLVQRHTSIETFWHFGSKVLCNQLLAPNVLCKLLQALNSLIIREYLVYLAILEAFHLYFPLIIFIMIVVKAWAGILRL